MNWLVRVLTWPVRKGLERHMASIIAGLIRHALTAAGAAGFMGGDDLEKTVGSLTFLIGLGWSIYEKVKTKKALAQ